MTVDAQLSATRLLLRQCTWLAGAAAVLWVILAIPAWLAAGADGLEGLSYAAALCLIPGWAIYLLAGFCTDKGARTIVIVAGGLMLRFVFVLVGLLAIPSVRPRLGFREFVIWLMVFYLATLLIETLHFVWSGSTGDRLGQARC